MYWVQSQLKCGSNLWIIGSLSKFEKSRRQNARMHERRTTMKQMKWRTLGPFKEMNMKIKLCIVRCVGKCSFRSRNSSTIPKEQKIRTLANICYAQIVLISNPLREESWNVIAREMQWSLVIAMEVYSLTRLFWSRRAFKVVRLQVILRKRRKGEGIDFLKGWDRQRIDDRAKCLQNFNSNEKFRRIWIEAKNFGEF